VAHVLEVAAFQLRDPVVERVLVEPDDAAIHAVSALGTTFQRTKGTSAFTRRA